MEPKVLLDMLHIAEKLKDETRHCLTSKGRRESVAEHCWRLALMAYWLKDEFPELNIDKVIKMCLIHDLGEAFTGDIPVFEKTEADSQYEEALLYNWLETLPENIKVDMLDLYKEMSDMSTDEAKLYKALDGLEALIQHNESDISTWEENEYELQLHYATNRMSFSPYMQKLRDAVRQDSIDKINDAKASKHCNK